MNKYNNGSISFKGLNIRWNKYREEDQNEVFNINISDGIKSFRYDFFNCVMEYEITQYLKQNFDLSNLKNYMSKVHKWGGYKEVKTLKDLDKKRIYNLLYSVIYDAVDTAQEQSTSFKEFCLNYGYDIDSRKAEKTYNKLIEIRENLNELNINWGEFIYIFEDDVRFKKEVVQK